MIAEQLTLEQFHQKYAEAKPYWEFDHGFATQKPLPTRLHSKLQLLLALIFQELGFFIYPELTLRIDPDWEPTPDLTASLSALEGDYPTQPVDIVIEISPPTTASPESSTNAATTPASASKPY